MLRVTKPVAWILKASGAAALALLYYSIFMLSLYLVSLAALQKNVIFNVWPLIEFQRREYFGEFPIVGTRNVWQRFRDCVQVDPYVVYRPKNGSCRFVNHEFDTQMNFDDLGRKSGDTTDLQGKGVAVLGDSFAMGWGVQDNETFSALLQDRLKRRVFNLGVSSYGTRRELRRLVQAGVLDRVDTILIQYCENDLGENAKPLTDADFAQKAKDYPLNITFEESKKTLPQSFGFKDNLWLLWTRLYYAVDEPLAKFEKIRAGELDFGPHYDALMAVLSEYKDKLADKKIVIFYVNGGTETFRNFPEGPDRTAPNVVFHQPRLVASDFFPLDKHLNAQGHRHVADAFTPLPTR